MAQPVQAQPQRRRPAEVTVPQLSPEETRRRAERGFDAAVASVLRSQFTAAPPAAEIAAVRRMVDERMAPGQTVDVGAVLDEYARANPNSVIARYLRATNGSTDWMMSGNRIGFNVRALQDSVRSQLNAGKTAFADALVTLCNPRNRSNPVDVSAIAQLMPDSTMPELQRQLATQFRTGRNQVPATVAYDGGQQQFTLTSLIPPPAQDMDFSKGKKG